MDRQAGPMTAATWGCCPAPRCPGELLTRGDVYHVHASRAEAERCGVLLGGTPELVRLEDPARGLPCGVVAVKRRERTATSPGLEVRDVSRRGASPAVAGRVRGPVRPHQPPPTPEQIRTHRATATMSWTMCASAGPRRYTYNLSEPTP